MDLEELKERLRKYKKDDIIITKHAELQAFVREVDLEEVKEKTFMDLSRQTALIL